VAAARSLGAQHGVAHYQLELTGNRTAFAKVRAADADPGFAAEASGLRWLAQARAVPVPEVLAADDSALVIAWVPEGPADRTAARRFGRDLAALHTAGAARFGAPWPGIIAGLPLPNEPLPNEPLPNEPLPHDSQPGEPDAGRSWPEWYAAARVLPYVRIAAGNGALSAADVRVIEAAAAHAPAVAGPPEPPSRIHGDCWSGNVLWSGGRGWLIDPAAHGGHRETDLAMLALFGAPYLADILAAYQEAAPLAPGWRDRVPLHQLHPLLVHACLFGASYAAPSVEAARAVLAL
jgi:fructosamine-3-kinase